jgi:hypothetical protein
MGRMDDPPTSGKINQQGFSQKRAENHINTATSRKQCFNFKNHGQTTTNKLHKWRQYHYKHGYCRLWPH